MNKKVMALAVAGALAAPAAALAQVEIGGSIHLQYFNNDSGSSLSKKTDVLTTSEPEIYVRGEDKLGGGMSAWFQCTSSLDVLGTAPAAGQSSGSTAGAPLTTATTTSAAPGQWCGRNSAIGMKGGFGNIFAGNWDTPQKLVSNKARGWWGGTNTLQGGSQVLVGNGAGSDVGNGGLGTNAQSSFFRRQNRSISYWSPTWSGFNVNAMFSAGNEATALPETSPLKPRMYSISGMYEIGPFFAGLGYESHKDYNPSNQLVTYNGGTDTNWNLTAGYTVAGVARLSALYMDNKYEIGDAAGNDLKKKGYALYADWRISGPHSLYAQYSVVDDTKGSATSNVGGYVADPTGALSTGAKVMGIAYGYSFSKRTQGYIAYNELKNDDNANMTMGTSAGSVGGKQSVIGAGLRFSF